MTGPTPSQTAGPFLHLGLVREDGPFVVPEGTPGALWITGTVYDGHGAVPDALVETWQADPEGRFDHPDDPRGFSGERVPGFRGLGRCATDATGRYRIHTVKPGPLPCPDGALEAPHIDISLFARGLLDRVVTRLYFPDQKDLNAADPVLSSVPDERRGTLVAEPDAGGLQFDIRLQGDGETVFFRV